MTTDYHTAISTGAAANAATFNTPLAALDAAVGDWGGGANITDEVLKGWAVAGAFKMTSKTPDTTYPNVVASATVVWPDGSAGTFTATSINGEWEAVDAYTITHTDSGLTVTQSAVTRDANGVATTEPALSVS